MTEEEENFEKENEEKVYRERLLYAGELTKRISAVLNSCENYAPAYESLMNLRSFLLPVIKKDVSQQSLALQGKYRKFVSFLPQPVLNMPTQFRRPGAYGGGTHSDSASQLFMVKRSHTTLYWQDFPAAARDVLMNYFVPGQCVQSSQVQQLAFYVFARAEVELIIKSADAHGLLLVTGSSVAQGGMSLYDADAQE